jgi:uroporphyrinogen decarboxylase
MTPTQWDNLLRLVSGAPLPGPLAGFIIDSPWLPGWCGKSLLDYYGDDRVWLECNLQAAREFPEVIFLPGFWSEYGMCTEPSAFGARCTWHAHELPFADLCVRTPEEMKTLRLPDPRCDGLLPFMLGRLVRNRAAVQAAGHEYRFAVARGPLNIATFLMGTTEFLMALKLQPEETHAMLNTITAFLEAWLQLQKETLPELDGILLLDDIVGFLDPDDCREFALPYLRRAFAAFPSSVRFFHNDAHGLVCAPLLPEMGVNLFNFSHLHSIPELRALAGESVALLGNLPPRDVLAGATPEVVEKATKAMLASAQGLNGVLFSGGGGMSPGTPTANLQAFLKALGNP